ncbi:MAG: YicC family protein [Simkaniaceae bacterium]|nr:YicC family protein [Simkaniaceae bacterium]
MAKSMTGYGRSTLDTPFGMLTFELLSVNRKSLEMNLFLAKEFSEIEPQLRKWIGKRASRGTVTLRIAKEQNSPEDALLNVNSVRVAKEHWQAIADELGLESKLPLAFLAEQASRAAVQGPRATTEELVDALKPVFDAAADAWIEMRRVEGRALCEEIAPRLKRLTELVTEIEKSSEGILSAYREKIHLKMRELLDVKQDDERLYKEAALFAEKVDTTEELARLLSHIDQVSALLDEDRAVGKSIDFLCQEMLREAQTLSVKSSDLEITKLALEVKSEIEKVREQVQNIE